MLNILCNCFVQSNKFNENDSRNFRIVFEKKVCARNTHRNQLWVFWN